MSSESAALSSTGNQETVKRVPAEALVKWGKEIHDLIGRRAYEIFERRGCVHGSDIADWLWAESELLYPCRHELKELPGTVVLKAEMPGSFAGAEIEFSVEPRRVIVSGEGKVEGIYGNPEGACSGTMPARIFRIHELPADVDPSRATAALQGNILEIVMPKVAKAAHPMGHELNL